MIMSVNDHTIYPDEFRFYVNRLLETYLPIYGEKTFSQKNLFGGFLTTASNYVVQNYVMLDWATENGFTLTDEMKSTAKAQLDVNKVQKKLITDPDDVNVADVTIAMAKARMSLNLAQSVIDRLVTGWNEITTTR